MRLEQLDWESSDLLALLRDDDVYYVRVNYRVDKNSDDELPHPYGLGFNRLSNAKFKELLPMLDNGEAIIVRLTLGG